MSLYKKSLRNQQVFSRTLENQKLTAEQKLDIISNIFLLLILGFLIHFYFVNENSEKIYQNFLNGLNPHGRSGASEHREETP